MDLKHSLAYLVYLLLVTCLAFMTRSYFADQVNSWVLLCALPLSLMLIGETLITRISVIALTGIVISGIFLISYLAPPIALHVIFIFCITVICMFAIQQYENYSFPIFIINFFAIIYIDHHDLARSIVSVLLGTIIAIFLQLVFFAVFQRAKSQVNLVSALKSLKSLTQDIFDTFLKPEYIDNVYLFERRLHDRKSNYLQAIYALRTNGKSYIHSLENLYDILLSCAALRWRIGDHSTFSICENELTAIGKRIDELFDGIIKSITAKRSLLNTLPLTESIKQFEAIYHHVLQVAGREPYIFPIFIFDLQSLIKEMNHLNELVLDIT